MPVLAAVFAAAAVHDLLLPARNGGVHLHHPPGCPAVVCTALAMSGAGASGHTGAGSAHSGAGGVPLLTGLLLASCTVHVPRTGLLLAPAGAATAVRGSTAEVVAGEAARPCAGALPELAAVCRLSMSTAVFTENRRAWLPSLRRRPGTGRWSPLVG